MPASRTGSRSRRSERDDAAPEGRRPALLGRGSAREGASVAVNHPPGPREAGLAAGVVEAARERRRAVDGDRRGRGGQGRGGDRRGTPGVRVRTDRHPGDECLARGGRFRHDRKGGAPMEMAERALIERLWFPVARSEDLTRRQAHGGPPPGHRSGDLPNAVRAGDRRRPVSPSWRGPVAGLARRSGSSNVRTMAGGFVERTAAAHTCHPCPGGRRPGRASRRTAPPSGTGSSGAAWPSLSSKSRRSGRSSAAPGRSPTGRRTTLAAAIASSRRTSGIRATSRSCIGARWARTSSARSRAIRWTGTAGPSSGRSRRTLGERRSGATLTSPRTRH